jgi:hypothetical protein
MEKKVPNISNRMSCGSFLSLDNFQNRTVELQTVPCWKQLWVCEGLKLMVTYYMSE